MRRTRRNKEKANKERERERGKGGRVDERKHLARKSLNLHESRPVVTFECPLAFRSLKCRLISRDGWRGRGGAVLIGREPERGPSRMRRMPREMSARRLAATIMPAAVEIRSAGSARANEIPDSFSRSLSKISGARIMNPTILVGQFSATRRDATSLRAFLPFSFFPLPLRP